MKLFIRDLLILTLGLILLNLGLYYFVTKDLLYKDYEVDLNEVSGTDVFIFADSHGWMLTKDSEKNAKTLRGKGIYNFSYGSESYHDIYLKLNWLFNNGIKPKKILISADRHMLSKKRDKNNNLNRSIFYSSYGEYSQIKKKRHIDYYVRKNVVRYLPMASQGNSKLIKEFLYGKVWPDQDKLLIEWATSVDSTRIESAKNKALDHFQSGSKSKDLVKSLKLIFSFCEKHEIEIIGVKFPLDGIYLDLIKNMDLGVDSVFTASNIKILDYENLYYNKSQLFLNQDHLNTSGATTFIDKLIEDVLEQEFEK